MLGEEIYQYNPTSYLVASVQLPITGKILEATPQSPYLCLRLSFSSEQILDIMKDSNQIFSEKII